MVWAKHRLTAEKCVSALHRCSTVPLVTQYVNGDLWRLLRVSILGLVTKRGLTCKWQEYDIFFSIQNKKSIVQNDIDLSIYLKKIMVHMGSVPIYTVLTAPIYSIIRSWRSYNRDQTCHICTLTFVSPENVSVKQHPRRTISWKSLFDPWNDKHQSL